MSNDIKAYMLDHYEQYHEADMRFYQAAHLVSRDELLSWLDAAGWRKSEMLDHEYQGGTYYAHPSFDTIRLCVPDLPSADWELTAPGSVQHSMVAAIKAALSEKVTRDALKALVKPQADDASALEGVEFVNEDGVEFTALEGGSS